MPCYLPYQLMEAATFCVDDTAQLFLVAAGDRYLRVSFSGFISELKQWSTPLFLCCYESRRKVSMGLYVASPNVFFGNAQETSCSLLRGNFWSPYRLASFSASFFLVSQNWRNASKACIQRQLTASCLWSIVWLNTFFYSSLSNTEDWRIFQRHFMLFHIWILPGTLKP